MGSFDFFKFKNNSELKKEIRSDSEWEENGFDPLFEKIARILVVKKLLQNSYFMKKFKIGITRTMRIMQQLEQAKIIDIITNEQSKYLSKYRAIINFNSLNKILEDLETLKKDVMTVDEIRGKQWEDLGLDENYESVVANESCYLYLMKDFNTGYYKIGISNNPEHREKTLQSEKPTIEMICNKKYVSRRMAHSFEQALHKTFSDKRVRGEWFNLNATDVQEIKLTLNSN